MQNSLGGGKRAKHGDPPFQLHVVPHPSSHPVPLCPALPQQGPPAAEMGPGFPCGKVPPRLGEGLEATLMETHREESSRKLGDTGWFPACCPTDSAAPRMGSQVTSPLPTSALRSPWPCWLCGHVAQTEPARGAGSWPFLETRPL